MPGIPRGSILKEAVPYAVVPLYNDKPPSGDASAPNICRNDKDPTHFPNLDDLPRWNTCQIWDQGHPDKISETPEIKKILRRARRMASSSSNSIETSWQILCILATLRVVEDKVFNEEKTNGDSRSTQQSGEYESPIQWWSPLVSEHYDDDKERKIVANGDDYENDNFSLLVELWPLIRTNIPWIACQRLYRRIQNRLHVLTIPHPLTTWSQKTIFELADSEFERSWAIFQNTESPEGIEKSSSSSPPNRLRASKFWSDRVADIPERIVGVLIEDPLNILEVSQPAGVSTSSNSMEKFEGSTALTLPRCHQSCLPNTFLELKVVTTMEKTPQVKVPAIENGENKVQICCRWIALYDLSLTESKIKNRTLSTMPRSSECTCFQCTYENKEAVHSGKRKLSTPTIGAANLAQARRLAHSYFHQEEFANAMSLYEQCHQYCTSSGKGISVTDVNSTNTKENAEWKAHAEADLWHTMGAVILSQQKFARAQQHWKNGNHYQSIHKELSEQLEKQRAYQYFHPLVARSSHETIRPSKQHILQNPSSTKKQYIFETSDVINVETCRKLISYAQDHALNNGGWTASRHYAVPTTDLPIHKVPKLLEWFQDWMPQVLFPLLEDQFVNTGWNNGDKQFYVHDAFLVRYEATASSCFLPLHFDESTHSCVLALNEDFDGGGSYIYDLNQSITPGTGGMVSFLGNRCLHGGNPVTRGVRYILAIFLFRDNDLARDPPKETDANGSFPHVDETKNKEKDITKRSKKEDGLQSHKDGGFSFSFF